jgi:hypothetical protein
VCGASDVSVKVAVLVAWLKLQSGFGVQSIPFCPGCSTSVAVRLAAPLPLLATVTTYTTVLPLLTVMVLPNGKAPPQATNVTSGLTHLLIDTAGWGASGVLVAVAVLVGVLVG